MSFKVKRPIPYQFVLDELEPLEPHTKPMFGCLAVYVGEKIVLVLREKESETQDNGVWLATSAEHHSSLKGEFPSMRSIEVFGGGVTSWQVLPADSDDFESLALRACELIREGDSRIGKIPKPKSKSKAKSKPKTRKSHS